ncbi:hypothetical protein AAOE16_01280 [Ekhidna sp. MALMAid0563]|uniref:ORC-CDC6 family AAA ATPase n=1 Tax=Ekhidna sp. MALMAid0563 TaxID=3143937 RepID=UPI0032DF20E3
MELYEKLGFSKNPFSTFSAEEEEDFLNNVFVEPLYFNSIKNDISSGHSRFILGARGIGKTALILKLKREMDLKKSFSLIMDEFDGIPIRNNKSQFLLVILENIVRDLF